jgi:uncharacterized protein (DUF1015 family)
MVEIYPFKGITYNKKKIDRLDDVMAPPYDIISNEMQDDLYNKTPYNMIRLILGKQDIRDDNVNNRYTRAKNQYESWIENSILIEQDKTAIYPYKIEYQTKNIKKIMTGFFALLKLDPDYNYVKAHEKTLSKPKADRLNLIRQCKSNFEAIELLYIDKEDTINKKIDQSLNKPLIKVKGYDNFIHKLWVLDDKDIISEIKDFLKDKILFIADGHHRYQTAINYSKEMKDKTGNFNENASFNFKMVILVNIFDDGLSILPTHRLIKKPDLDCKSLLKSLEKYFFIEKKQIKNNNKNYSDLRDKIKLELEAKKEHKFVLYHSDNYYILTLKDKKIMNNYAKDKSIVWKTLDVSILHKIILEKLMGINETNLEDHVRYTRSDIEAMQFVDENKYDFSFLMNPTKIEELKLIAEAGEHMPQKSTYFLPKMLSGLVMYKMKD